MHEPISIDIQKYSTSTRYSKIPRRPPETIFRLFLKTAKDVSMTTCLASNCLCFVGLLQKEIHNWHSNTPLRQYVHLADEWTGIMIVTNLVEVR